MEGCLFNAYLQTQAQPRQCYEEKYRKDRMTEGSLLGGAEGADAAKWSESVGLNQRGTGRLGLLRDVLGKERESGPYCWKCSIKS